MISSKALSVSSVWFKGVLFKEEFLGGLHWMQKGLGFQPRPLLAFPLLVSRPRSSKVKGKATADYLSHPALGKNQSFFPPSQQHQRSTTAKHHSRFSFCWVNRSNDSTTTSQGAHSRHQRSFIFHQPPQLITHQHQLSTTTPHQDLSAPQQSPLSSQPPFSQTASAMTVTETCQPTSSRRRKTTNTNPCYFRTTRSTSRHPSPSSARIRGGDPARDATINCQASSLPRQLSTLRTSSLRVLSLRSIMALATCRGPHAAPDMSVLSTASRLHRTPPLTLARRLISVFSRKRS